MNSLFFVHLSHRSNSQSSEEMERQIEVLYQPSSGQPVAMHSLWYDSVGLV